MLVYPRPLQELIKEFKKLPSIGRKTAERLIFYLLNQDKRKTEQLIRALKNLEGISTCPRCYSFAQGGLCSVCRDESRDRSTICVVSRPQEILKIEETREYKGLYHVLGGLISPVEDVEPEDLRIAELMTRLKDGQPPKVKEIILALDPKVEGETTAMYLAKKIKPLGIKISQLAHGVPVGRDIEFADEVTLSKALKGRVEI